MSSDLSDQCSALSETDKFRLICDLVGDMPAKSIKGLVQTVEETFQVKVPKGPSLPFDPTTVFLEPGPIVEPPPTHFDVILTAPGASKLQVIRQVRSHTSLALREAKAFVDTVPQVLSEGLSEDEAKSLRQRFEDLGATVELKPSTEA